MKNIEKVIICGIGAIGSIYADKIQRYNSENLRVLVDKQRLEKYTKNPKTFNGKPMKFNYILPDNTDYKADLIIIATKFDGLNEVIKNIKNFVKEDTIILSLLNGVTSEEIIAAEYGWKNLPVAYYIGHSAMRDGNKITHDGINTIVFGIKDPKNTDAGIIDTLRRFFDSAGINYQTPDDMLHSYWLKFMLNVSSNQPSAILKMTFGDMQKNKSFHNLMKNIINEIAMIAKAEGVKSVDTMYEEAAKAFAKMSPEGKTSMLQDVEAQRKTEAELFAGTVIALGKKHNIPTPYNTIMKEFLEIIHDNYEK